MKHKIWAAGFLLLVVCTVLYWYSPSRTAGNGNGSATGAYALQMLRKMYGDGYVEKLADLEKAAKDQEPQVYLRERSEFIIDEAAIDERVEESVLGAESTAMQSGIGVEQYLKENWGYESLDDYREKKKQEYMEFMKERLAVYEAARLRHITVSVKEYKELLWEYAQMFGYDSIEQFELECDKDSIACEMLYDKTIRSLQ